MQVTVIAVQGSSLKPLRAPFVKLTLGDQSFRTARSHLPTGDWSEAFVFSTAFHSQLFGTLQAGASCELEFLFNGII